MTEVKKEKTVMGRPKGQGEPQVTITFVVTEDMKKTLIYMAAQEGITLSFLLKCMAEKEIPDCILSDIQKARLLQVAGTPTFFIRSQPYPGNLPEGALEAALEQERQKQKK